MEFIIRAFRALHHRGKVRAFWVYGWFRRKALGQPIHTRKIETYQEYLDLQLLKTSNPKLRLFWAEEDWNHRLKIFSTYFRKVTQLHNIRAGKAICVGARLGQEVQALRDLGWDCIGFDLLPHAHLVREGDMHSLPVESESFDFIFSNAFDHSLYPRLFVAEMERVVRPGGWIVLHIQLNKQDDKFGVTDVFSADAVSSLFLNSRIVASGPMEEMLSMNYEFVLRRD